MKTSDSIKTVLIETLHDVFGQTASRKDIIKYFKDKSENAPSWLVNNKEYRLTKGLIDLSLGPKNKATQVMSTNVVPEMAATVHTFKAKRMEQLVDDLVPPADSTYVPFGFYRDLELIIKSKAFYPQFITGLSGNGKTTMVEQVCSKLKRECIRVNISIETDEDDLVGGNTLVDGNVVFREGPVITAMRRGAILLIDEIDRGSNKLMCIQGILEGKPFFIKKTGEVVHPAEGFNIIATANTKGRGTEDGKFIAAQILDEAFLERFPITVEQEYPSTTVERKIVINNMKALECTDEDFADKLVGWAEIIRKTYVEGAIDEIISTRRLVHIVKAYSVFKNKEKAINLCINRFDSDTKTAFMDLYNKMHATEEAQVKPAESKDSFEEIPF
jgi:MoxR-like ATPase